MSDDRIAMIEARLEAQRLHIEAMARRMNEMIEAGDALAAAVEQASETPGAEGWALMQRGYHRWMLARS